MMKKFTFLAIALSLMSILSTSAQAGLAKGVWVLSATVPSGVYVYCNWARLNNLNGVYYMEYTTTVGLFACPKPAI
ncbi:hypothetical protein HZU77_014225 [Neisseriaceae bacterium TC5R-5]|nr:hypothetical protein [Neisseriaceae bacterium TC5R-5]